MLIIGKNGNSQNNKNIYLCCHSHDVAISDKNHNPQPGYALKPALKNVNRGIVYS